MFGKVQKPVPLNVNTSYIKEYNSFRKKNILGNVFVSIVVK